MLFEPLWPNAKQDLQFAKNAKKCLLILPKLTVHCRISTRLLQIASEWRCFQLSKGRNALASDILEQGR
jgi:hypothetical protein